MKLYIGNLSYETTESVLRELLAEFEPIADVFLPMDRETGRPRGFAFVTLDNFQSGEAAIAALDGKEVNGRRLRVNEAEDRGGGGGGGAPPRRAPQDNPMDFTTKRRDDRPTGADGKKVRYKGI